MDGLRRLIHEIHRRSLWQVLGIYVVGSWFVVQVVQTLTESLGMPLWFPQFAVVLILIGLPIVLATAFVQEGIGTTPTGERSKEASGVSAPAQAPALLTWRNAIGGGVLAFALWGVVAAGWLVLGSRGTTGVTRGDAEPADTRPFIAVLPFNTVSAGGEDASFFATGIHDDLLTQLSKINGVHVIARTSVMRYEDTDKTIPEIGRELGVSAIIEGGVQRAGDQVRINVQLIDAQTNTHLWAETYNRALTVSNVFAVQTDIVRQVANALRATFTPEEERRIEAAPTDNLEAYELYLRGRAEYLRYTPDANEEAFRLYQRALALDPGYALAMAGLADAFSQRGVRYALPGEWVDSALAWSRKAVDVDPDLGEGWKALGLAHLLGGSWGPSLEASLEAVRLGPNNADAVGNVGIAHVVKGEIAEGLEWMNRCLRLAPSQLAGLDNIATAYAMLGEYELAETFVDRALQAGAPEASAGYRRAFIRASMGDVQEALDLVGALSRASPSSPRVHAAAAIYARLAGDLDASRRHAFQALDMAPIWSGGLGLPTDAQIALAFVDLREGKRQEAGSLLARVLATHTGPDAAGRDSYDDSWRVAQVHALRGEIDDAITALEAAYERGLRQYPVLELDPVYDALRGDARFRALIERIKTDIEAQRVQVERDETAAGLR